MAHEADAPWSDLHTEGDPPRRRVVSMVDESGSWKLEQLLSEADGATTLHLAQRQVAEEQLGEVGQSRSVTFWFPARCRGHRSTATRARMPDADA